MSEPCPLCGREKLKDRVQRAPPMTEGAEVYCLHASHIYAADMPPCEVLGIQRIRDLERLLRGLTAAVALYRPTKGVGDGHERWGQLFDAYIAASDFLK